MLLIALLSSVIKNIHKKNIPYLRRHVANDSRRDLLLKSRRNLESNIDVQLIKKRKIDTARIIIVILC